MAKSFYQVTSNLEVKTKHLETWSKRLWYRHPLGFGRKASSQLFEGVFQSDIPRVGGEGWRESADALENDISTATATTRSVTGIVFCTPVRVYH
jgi:hypothetical protein